MKMFKKKKQKEIQERPRQSDIIERKPIQYATKVYWREEEDHARPWGKWVVEVRRISDNRIIKREYDEEFRAVNYANGKFGSREPSFKAIFQQQEEAEAKEKRKSTVREFLV